MLVDQYSNIKDRPVVRMNMNKTQDNFDAANATMGLDPKEIDLYQRHLTNLYGTGGVDNPDGSRSTLYQATMDANGKTYNVPTVWDGKILEGDDLKKKIDQEGIEQFPSYPSREEAQSRYDQMHGFMEKDTQGYLASRMPPGASTEPADAFKSSQSTPTPAKLSILNTLRGMVSGPNTEEDKKLLTGFYDTVKSAFKLPGDVYAGKVDPMSKQGIERASELASLMIFGPAPVASKMANGTLGSFAGVRSMTDKMLRSLAEGKGIPPETLALRHKLLDAISMDSKGHSLDDIWEKTGWFKGADNRWKREISDQNSNLKIENLEDYPHIIDNKYRGYKVPEPGFIERSRIIQGKDKAKLKLTDVLDHPELYETYPFLKETGIIPTSGFERLEGTRGWYNAERNLIALSPGTGQEMRSTILHEIQHGIQNAEGFSWGASPEAFASFRWKSLSSEFRDFMKGTIDDIMKAGGTREDVINWKKAVAMEDKIPELKKALEEPGASWQTYDKFDIMHLEDNIRRAKNANVYDKLKRIVKGEKIQEEYGKLLYQHYHRVKGEVESRNVQNRMDWSNMDRESLVPTRSEEYPREQQLWSPWDPASLIDME